MTPNTIDRDTYVHADTETRHALTYDMLMGLHTKFDTQLQNCEKRFCKLENNKRKNTAIASASGFVGGIVASVGKFLFG